MLERTISILEDYVEEGTEITAESALVDDLGLSSLEVINLVSAFEEEFNIEVPDRVIPTLRTVGDIVAYLEENAE